MDKQQNYNIRIKNLETKRFEDFLLSPSTDNPVKVVGSDNLAPKYQIGKMEYGDFTNHSVWAQSDWSEGGGAKYFNAYKDGYSVYPYSKKYFSKSGLRTVDYPGELVLGANALLMENFPEREGSIAKIVRYGQTLFVAVNLEEKCRVYKTANGGNNWIKVYDSSEQPISSSSNYDLTKFNQIFDMSVGYLDSADRRYTSRTDPNTGVSIPLNKWDKWWQERRSPMSMGYIFLTVKGAGVLSWIVKIPISGYYYAENDCHGFIQEPINSEYQITKIESAGDESFSGTVYLQSLSGGNNKFAMYMGEDVDMTRFYTGQYIDIYDGETKSTTAEIKGISGRYLITQYGGYGPNGSARTVKFNSATVVLELNSPLKQIVLAKDKQGNGIDLHPFRLNIKNKTKNNKAYVRVSCGNGGISHQNVIGATYTGYTSVEQTLKYGSEAVYYYTYYKPAWIESVEEGDPIIHPEERDGWPVDEDYRNYVVISDYYGFGLTHEVGDFIEIDKVISINDSVVEKPICGILPRKDTTARRSDLFFNNSSYLMRKKYPNDAYFNSSEFNPWVAILGEVTAYSVNESQRELVIGTRNQNLIQCYVYQADSDSSGTLASLFDIGELSIGSIVKQNESIYIGSNDKGRIYEWNGTTYKVLQRFSLDPTTNDHYILASDVFMNKIIITDNYNGIIMSYDPEEDVWDDLCAPEYLKAKDDRITSFGFIGGTLFFGTNRRENLLWKFEEKQVSNQGHLVSSWYSADMPAVDKKGLYVQILAQSFIKSNAKVRIAIQFDYQDTWYYLPKERNQILSTEYTELHEATFEDFKSNRAFYFFFPYNSPRFKTVRYRIEIVGGSYRTKQGAKGFFRPVLNNVDVFYILTDPKEMLFTYPIILEKRMQTLGGPGSNEIGRHRDKLAFLMDIWNNDVMVEITHVDGEKFTCIPFKPVQMTGGGMSVFYNNIEASRKNLSELSYLITMMFKNINKIDNYGK